MKDLTFPDLQTHKGAISGRTCSAGVQRKMVFIVIAALGCPTK
jgi:hypothetical protein